MPTPGKNFPSSPAYFPTPDSHPETSACRTFRVPDNDEWLGVLMAAVEVLRQSWRWYPWGELTADEAADAWNDIIVQAYDDSFEDTCPVTTVPTPYWDEDGDVDDVAERDVQTWYGYVSDLDNPTTTFVEDAAIWTFAGFLALSGAPAAAIAFTTVAPQFVVAIRRGDLGEIIRLYLDGDKVQDVDTTAYSEGDVIRVLMMPEAAETHDILLVRME